MNYFLSFAWIHDLDPYIIQFTENFGIRWYGVSYLIGMISAIFLLRKLVSIKIMDIKMSQINDFVSFVFLFGVILGGRLGYMLFYDTKNFISNPLSFFNFLNGGMSSHGGFIGVAVAIFIYSKIIKKSWLHLGDNLVVATPIGIFFGRMANFINGELYGKVCNNNNQFIGIRFLSELNGIIEEKGIKKWQYSIEELIKVIEKSKNIAPNLYLKTQEILNLNITNINKHSLISNSIIEYSIKNPSLKNIVADNLLNFRHPSQLYEAFIEGVLLFVVLITVRFKYKNLTPGILTGLFFIIYGIGRIFVEFFREPDASFILFMSRGQFYSIFMIFIGLGFILYSCIHKRNLINKI